jgi:flagellar hook-associated protein 2
VNQIVTNLQSVETPWKTQLTKLQGRDSVLSSLGTQLSTLTTDLQNLTDFQGVMASKTGSSSDTNVLQLMSAGPTAVAGTHTVTVQNLAQTSTAATGPVAASDVLTGGITFKIGNGNWQTVSVGDSGSEATLSGLSAAINSAGTGVQASVLTNADGTQRLSLVSQTGGSAGEITIANSSNHPASPTSLADASTPNQNPGLGLVTIQEGIDANFAVDGVSLTSGTNTVSGAIRGVTFQLLAAGGVSGSTSQTVQIVIANDTSSIESAVSTFVSDYNTAINAINAQEKNDSSGNAEPLYGTGVLAQLQQGLMSAICATFGTGAVNSLISLGIEAGSSDDGTITLDSEALTSALSDHFDQVLSFFQDAGGFGEAFVQTLNQLGNGRTSGAIAMALREDSNQEKTLSDDIADEEARIATQKSNLTNELNVANQILQSIPQEINQVNEMYSAITGYKGNS